MYAHISAIILKMHMQHLSHISFHSRGKVYNVPKGNTIVGVYGTSNKRVNMAIVYLWCE